jgi:hypothetical protein
VRQRRQRTDGIGFGYFGGFVGLGKCFHSSMIVEL